MIQLDPSLQSVIDSGIVPPVANVIRVYNSDGSTLITTIDEGIKSINEKPGSIKTEPFGAVPIGSISVEVFGNQGLSEKLSYVVEFDSVFRLNDTLSPVNTSKIYICSVTYDKRSNTLTIKGYDYFNKLNTKYEPVTIDYPCSLKDWVAAFYSQIGLELETNSMFMGNFQLTKPPNLDDTYTMLSVAQRISLFTLSIIYVAPNNKVRFVRLSSLMSAEPVYSIIGDVKEYSDSADRFKSQGINTLVLALQSDIEGETVSKSDAAMIAIDERVELRLDDIPFVPTQSDKEGVVDEMFDEIKGFKYKAFDITVGLGRYFFLEPGDVVKQEIINYGTEEEPQYENIVILSVDNTYKGSIQSKLSASADSITDSEYDWTGISPSTRAEIKVDKVNLEILKVVSSVGEFGDKVNETIDTVDGLTQTVSSINNVNIWYNANGELDYDGWTFEQDGLLPSNDLLPSEDLLPVIVSSPIFTSKIYPESLSEYGIEFDTIGYAFSKKARVVQGSDQYSIRMRRMDAYPNLRISVIEYSDDSDTPSKTTQIINTTAPNVYENASISLESSTLFIKIAVYNPTETIHGLTENMFNRGMPRAWFESASDVKAYAESQFIIFSEKIDLSNQSIDSLTGRIDNTLLRITADKGVEIRSTSGNGLTIYDANGNKTVELKTDGTIKAINGEFVDATITGNLNAGKVGNLVVTSSGIAFPDGKLKLDSSLNAILVGTLQLKHSTFDWSGNAADSFLLTGTGTTSVFEVKATTTGIVSVSDGSSHAIQLISSAIGGSANGMTISDSTSATEFILDQTSHKGALTNIGYINGKTLSVDSNGFMKLT